LPEPARPLEAAPNARPGSAACPEHADLVSDAAEAAPQAGGAGTPQVAGARLRSGPQLAPARPVPLLPPAPVPRTLSAPAVQAGGRAGGPQVATGGAADAGGDAAEVHIHIGRIEVTAAQEAATPRRRPAPSRAPMSLDAYLDRRRRGSS
jgi:hypothetical protein